MNTRPQSSQLAEPLWTDPSLESRISGRELIYTLWKRSKKKKGGGVGGVWMVEHSPKILASEKKATSTKKKKKKATSLHEMVMPQEYGLTSQSNYTIYDATWVRRQSHDILIPHYLHISQFTQNDDAISVTRPFPKMMTPYELHVIQIKRTLFNRTKRASFRCNHLFQATYNRKQLNQLIFVR